MSNGESLGLFGRLWNGIKKILCTLVCAWKEIVFWLLVMIFTLVLCYLIVLLGKVILVEVILTAPAGPGPWIANIILIIIVIIIIIILFVVMAFLISHSWQKMVRKIRQCWQVC